MRRILVFKFEEKENRFIIYDGFYSDQNAIKTFILPEGSYLFMPTS